jgi:diguanylate cyclase (GGDEF)-like protein/PAS domain S-box-containing protein
MSRISEERTGSTTIEERLAPLSKLPGDVVALIDLEGDTTYVSASVERTLGYRREEFLTHRAEELMHPDDLALVTLHWRRLATEPGAQRRWEHRVRHGDGTWRWMEILAINTADDPEIGAMYLNFRDITDRKLAEEALRASEARFRALVQNSYDVFVVVHPDHGIVYASPSLELLFGRSVVEILGGNPLDHVHPDDVDRVAHALARVASGVGERESIQARIRRADGGYRWIEAVSINRVDDDDVGGIVVNIRDITEQVLAERDTRRLTDIFEATSDLVAMADRRPRVLWLNRSARRFLEIPDHVDVADLDDFDLMTWLAPGVAEEVGNAIEQQLDAHGMWHGEIDLRRPDGTVIPYLARVLSHTDDDGGSGYYSAILHDISQAKAFEAQLAHQATHDPLTGLPNRTLLLDRLADAVARAVERQRRLAVLFLDLDHFKVVNDSLGHARGDELLVTIGERLRTTVRPGDTVARLGGDEFVILCQDLSGPRDAQAIAERVRGALSTPFDVGGVEVFVRVSIGIAFADDLDVEGETLIRDADAAMYQAKARGRGRWVLFDRAMRADAVSRLDTENALRRALDRRELRVYYQPVVGLLEGRVRGVEALVRWEHPERGLLQPDDFIRLAEETALIVPIGSWVLHQACRQVELWRVSLPHLDPLTVSVNLSGRQLNHPGLVDDVAAILTETGIDPGQVELEITESVLVDDIDLSHDTLVRLRRLGVRLVIDDFGTGYSSLSYLRRFPIDVLKIDRSFVLGLDDGSSGGAGDGAIVSAVVNLAHTLGITAVGEGVETAEQLDELRRVGCDGAQGFYLARPAPGPEIGQLLASNPTW